MTGTPADEPVAIVDPDTGQVVGSAPRARMRRERLWHLSTGVLVRNRAGEVYVHRRTETKDVFPGAHDVWAGGVVGAGEEPTRAAERELAEELGIAGVELEPLGTGRYEGPEARALAWLFEVRWDGPLRHQPEEVAWGGWMAVEELQARLRDPTWPFVPDGRQYLEAWLAGDLG